MNRSLRLALLTLLLAAPLAAPAGDPFPMDRAAQVERFTRVLTYWCGEADRRYGITPEACLAHVQARIARCAEDAALPDRLYDWGDFAPVAERYYACTEPARRHRAPG